MSGRSAQGKTRGKGHIYVPFLGLLPVVLSIVLPLLALLLLSACDLVVDNSQVAIPTPVSISTLTPINVEQPSEGMPTATNAVPTSAPTALPSTPSNISYTTDITQAWGSNLSVDQITVAVDDSHRFVLNTITPDARFLVGTVITNKQDELGGTEPARAVLLDVKSHQIIELHKFSKNDTQMLGASADSDWVVWAEAAQEPGFFADWVIYSYNRKTKNLKQVAQAPRDSAGKPLVGGGFVSPKVDHGLVVWSQIPATGSDNIHSLVMSTDLTTGQVSVLSNLGLQPTISWPYVGWESPVEVPSTTTTERPTSNIQIRNLLTGETKILAKTHNPSGFALYKASVVWITEQANQVILTNINESESRVIVGGQTPEESVSEGDIMQFPSINDRLVTWVSYRKVAAWDRIEQRLVNLVDPYTRQGNSLVNGNGYVWQSGGSEQELTNPDGSLDITSVLLNVIDSARLPIQ